MNVRLLCITLFCLNSLLVAASVGITGERQQIQQKIIALAQANDLDGILRGATGKEMPKSHQIWDTFRELTDEAIKDEIPQAIKQQLLQKVIERSSGAANFNMAYWLKRLQKVGVDIYEPVGQGDEQVVPILQLIKQALLDKNKYIAQDASELIQIQSATEQQKKVVNKMVDMIDKRYRQPEELVEPEGFGNDCDFNKYLARTVFRIIPFLDEPTLSVEQKKLLAMHMSVKKEHQEAYPWLTSLGKGEKLLGKIHQQILLELLAAFIYIDTNMNEALEQEGIAQMRAESSESLLTPEEREKRINFAKSLWNRRATLSALYHNIVPYLCFKDMQLSKEYQLKRITGDDSDYAEDIEALVADYEANLLTLEDIDLVVKNVREFFQRLNPEARAIFEQNILKNDEGRKKGNKMVAEVSDLEAASSR